MSVDVNLIEYENTPVKLVALRKTPKIETPGLAIDEVDERKEFSVPFWVAGVLVESGLAKYGEEGLTMEEWTSTHFKERFNPGGPPGALPKDFYQKAYVSLRLSAKAAEGDAAKTEQINRLHARFREIIDSRVGKVTRIATTETALQPGILQPEEQALYQELEHIVTGWRRDIRRLSTR
ncbi:TPA: DNA replication complex GINS family protein [Candidatus Bathyarchaeota archaeon]|nr:DNA replication complex GINS family protein [Candidatus Bathyarchaeota archaeon]